MRGGSAAQEVLEILARIDEYKAASRNECALQEVARCDAPTLAGVGEPIVDQESSRAVASSASESDSAVGKTG